MLTRYAEHNEGHSVREVSYRVVLPSQGCVRSELPQRNCTDAGRHGLKQKVKAERGGLSSAQASNNAILWMGLGN